MKNHPSLFVAATRQNDGKTMMSLGLFYALNERLKDLGYMKPIGQQYCVVGDEKVDKDAVLFQKVFNLKDPFTELNPIAVEKGFTRQAILENNTTSYEQKLIKSYKKLCKKHPYMLIEGTGHAGVGSVMGLSNARVAELFSSKALLVTMGGIGRAIDEVMLNVALFASQKIPLKGLVFNKVDENRLDQITPSLSRYFDAKKLKIYGYVPFVPSLIRPTIAGIFEALDYDIICGQKHLLNKVNEVVIGDMAPHDALSSLSLNTLLIVPANREGLIMTALLGNLVQNEQKFSLSGIIFTGGKSPHINVMDLIKKYEIPTIIVHENSFQVTQKINKLLIKLRHEELEKIQMVKELVLTHVDIDSIISDYFN